MKRVFGYPALILLAVTSCILFACQKSMAKPPGQEGIKATTMTKPFTLTLSTGGGFSGLVEGFTLNSKGEVTAWQKNPGNPETSLWTRKDAPDSAIALVESLKGFLSVDMQETGNMTTRIRLELPDSAWQWSKSGAGAAIDSPEPFGEWYNRAIAYCLSLNSMH